MADKDLTQQSNLFSWIGEGTASSDVQLYANLMRGGFIYDLFMQAPACICIVRGPQYIIDFVNPSFCQLCANRSLLRMPAREGFPELVGQGFFFELDQVYATGQPSVRKEMLVCFDHKNNGVLEESYFDVTYQPIHTSDTSRIGILVFMHDVTSQVQARQSLQMREAYYHALIENSYDGIYLIDALGNLRYASPSIERLLGYQPEEFTQLTTALSLVHPEDSERVRTVFQRLQQSPSESVSVAYRMRHKKGHYCWIDSSGTNLLHEPGIEAIVFHFHDITERKEVELRLQERELRLKRLIDTNLLGVSFWRTDGVITEANDVFLDMLGYSREDLLAERLNWNHLTPVDYLEQNQRAFHEVQTYGVMFNPIEKEYIRKDGTRISVLVRSAFFDTPQQEGMSFALDITHLKELELRKDTFIRMASHELKTPLTSIKGFTQILQRHFRRSSDDESLQLLSKVERHIQRLTRLVNEMLNVAQIDMGMELAYHFDRFDLCDLVRMVTDHLRSIHTTYQFYLYEDGSLPVAGDQERTSQVLVNLIANAIKYSTDLRRVVIRLTAEPDYAQVCVQDFGIGIAPEEQQKIFEKFYRVDNMRDPLYPGLGVGLYLSSAIIQRQGGRIWVESEEGEGSTFYFTMPLAKLE